MQSASQDLIRLAEAKMKTVYRWSIFYWGLHNYFNFFSWAVAVAVPFALTITLYLPPEQSKRLNVPILIISGTGLVLQILASVMRFRERAQRGRSAVAKLEGSLLKFKQGVLQTDEFLAHFEQFLIETSVEEGP